MMNLIKKIATKVTTKVKGVVEKLENRTTRIKTYLTYTALSVMTAPMTVFAEADGDASWNTVMTFIVKWIPRLGGVLLFIGGVEFAIAYKNEDANSKTNAVRLMVAGAMVIAIPTALNSLLMA